MVLTMVEAEASPDNRRVLEEFLMDIEILEQVEKEVSVFNAFETLSIMHTEIRHSNVLAWLMTPMENHGLGDYILKKIAQKTIYHNGGISANQNYDPLQLSLMDYHDFTIRREWRDIDIFAVSEANKFVIAIENKVWSKESDHQLAKYFKIVQDEYPDYQQLFIYLTPFGDESSNPDVWLSLDYDTVINIIVKGMDLKKDLMSEAVEMFIQQYVDMVRRYIVRDDELEKVCRDIYFKHKKALDLIFEYKPDIYSDISDTLQAYIREQPNLILDDSSKGYIRFTSKKIDALIERDGEGWTSSNRILLFEIRNRGNRLSLHLLIGPTQAGKEALRREIFDYAVKNDAIFKGVKHKYSQQYTQIYAEGILPRGFDEQMEHEEILTRVIDKFETFIKKRLGKIEDSIEQMSLQLSE